MARLRGRARARHWPQGARHQRARGEGLCCLLHRQAQHQREHQWPAAAIFPERKNISHFSQAYLNKIAVRLNQRPRKTPGIPNAGR